MRKAGDNRLIPASEIILAQIKEPCFASRALLFGETEKQI
jgi:hypothetical protein